MKPSSSILSRRGFLGSSLLGGLAAAFLRPDRVEAAPAAALAPQVKLTTFVVPRLTLPGFGISLTKIGSIGQFTSYNSASLIEVTYMGRLRVNTLSVVGSAAQFLMDVDGLPPNAVWGLVQYSDVGKSVPATFTTFYENLPAANHTVNMYVAASSGGGTNAEIDPDGFGSSNMVIVKEYLPFGATYLPLIQN